MAERRDGGPEHHTVSEVRHENWDRKDLSGRTFAHVAFLDVDMTEAHSVGAVFDTCTFQDVAFMRPRTRTQPS